MATRMYFPSTPSQLVTLNWEDDWGDFYSWLGDATWTQAGIDNHGYTQRPLNTGRVGSAFSEVEIQRVSGDLSDLILYAQFVSHPLAGSGTLSGTLKAQLRGRGDSGSDVNEWLVVGIISQDGSIRRGLAYDDGANVGPFETTLTNRKFANGDSLDSVEYQDGDRIVVEVGTSISQVGETGSIEFGDHAGTDLPEDNTSTDQFNPWIEFSQDLIFKSEAAPGGIVPVPHHRYWFETEFNFQDHPYVGHPALDFVEGGTGIEKYSYGLTLYGEGWITRAATSEINELGDTWTILFRFDIISWDAGTWKPVGGWDNPTSSWDYPNQPMGTRKLLSTFQSSGSYYQIFIDTSSVYDENEDPLPTIGINTYNPYGAAIAYDHTIPLTDMTTVVLTCAGGTLSIWIDGVLCQESVTGNFPSLAGGATINMFHCASGTPNFTGRVYDVCIWNNMSLSNAEIIEASKLSKSTRFYFTDGVTPDISPVFNGGGSGYVDDATTATRQTMFPTKQNSAFVSVDRAVTSNGECFLTRQYLSPPLAEQVLYRGCRVKCHLRAKTTDNAAYQFQYVYVMLVTSDGTYREDVAMGSKKLWGQWNHGETDWSETVLTNCDFGTYEGTDPYMAWSVCAAEDFDDSDVAFHINEGDRLVVEIGFFSFYNITATASIEFGDNSPNDLPENETSTDQYNPWIEFGQELLFSEGEGEPAGNEFTRDFPAAKVETIWQSQTGKRKFPL